MTLFVDAVSVIAYFVVYSDLVFVPLEVIGIIRRKALIKELAAAYHAECLTYCQELLELQKKIDEASNFILLVKTHSIFCIICFLIHILLT